MSAFSGLVQDAADEAFGPSARVHLRLREPHALSSQPRAWVAWAGDDDEVFAVGTGDTTDGAFRDLLRSVYSDDRTLSTEQAAHVLCVSPRRLQAMQATGQLVPVSAVAGNIGQRYSPTDVLRRAGLLRNPDTAVDSGLSATTR